MSEADIIGLILLVPVVRKLVSDFFKRCKNAQKAMKLQLWARQLIAGKFYFKIAKVNLSHTD